MGKRLEKRIYTMIMVAAVVLALAVPAQAASKTVTSGERKAIAKVLSKFDNYLGYGVDHKGFKFDDYARTTMSIMGGGATNRFLSESRNRITSFWKKYFTAKVRIKTRSYSKYGKRNTDPSYVFLVDNGRFVWTSGNWGEFYPKGYIAGITKKNSKTFVVNYDIHEYGAMLKRSIGKRVGYQITMKKVGSAYKIQKIKRTAVYEPFNGYNSGLYR